MSVPLPAGCSVMLDVVALRGSGDALAKEGAACAHRQVGLVGSAATCFPSPLGGLSRSGNLLGCLGKVGILWGEAHRFVIVVYVLCPSRRPLLFISFCCCTLLPPLFPL